MGEGTGGSLQVATPERGLDDPSINRELTREEVEGPDEAPLSRTELDAGRRRFTWAAVVALALTAVPYVWILWSEWGPANPLRKPIFEDNFYDLQARSMFHGHLSLASGSLGIEGFVHNGRTYTYFGLFPSIIRMPVLLVTSSLDGKLTAPYMLLAWLLTGLFVSMLLWRVRYLVRGSTAMGKGEAAGFGILIATLMGGTVWMLLAAIPYVFDEDISWSICLTIGSIFCLLGVMERPSWGRVTASGVLITCASLDRATTGWACVVGACLIALWFLLGFGGDQNRRWFLPVLGAGLIPLVIGAAANYTKFGVPFGVSVTEQVWTHVNAYRRKFLAANHNSEVGLGFIPTNIVSYLRPDGLSLSRVFPFVTLPATPPVAVGGHLFDRLYRTSSLETSSPLLFVLSIWGLVTAFRPHSVGRVARTRLLLLAAGCAAAALMLWGYVAPRYMGDFVPFLALASAVALADIFRRLEMRRRSVRIGTLVVLGVGALFSIAANIGMAIVPNQEWTPAQALNYVQTQKTISDLTGHPLEGRVVRADSLPAWGPAGQLYVIGNCNGLYISNGEDYSTVPSQQYQRGTWMTVQLGPAFQHTLRLTVNRPQVTESVPLARVDSSTMTVSAIPTSDPHRVFLTFSISGPATLTRSESVEVDAGVTHTVVVTTDPVKHDFEATMDGVDEVAASLANVSHLRVYSSSSQPNGTPGSLIVKSASTPAPSLCQSLLH